MPGVVSGEGHCARGSRLVPLLPWAVASCRWETRTLGPCPVTGGGGQVPLAVR